MFSLYDMSFSGELLDFFALPEFQVVFDVFHLNDINSAVRGFSALIFLLTSFAICLCFENNYISKKKRSIMTLFLSSFAFCWSVISLGRESIFLYFNF